MHIIVGLFEWEAEEFLLNVHIYPTTLEYESRILKVTETLVSSNIVNKVIVVGTSRPGLPKLEHIDAHRGLVRIKTWLQGRNFFLRAACFLEWSFRVLWYFRKNRIDMVNCHSLSSLPLCVVIKKLHGARLVYEPHELETETITFTGLKRSFAKLLERHLIKHASLIIVVSNSISAHYKCDYKLKSVSVVMNAPKITSTNEKSLNLLRDLYGLSKSDYLYMYQGVLEGERGVQLLLEAFQILPLDKHIVFMGFGSLEKEIKKAVMKFPNIHIHEPVSPSEVVKYTQGVDVGFSLLSDDCENHRCALPNKFFHYLHAGVPMIISDLYEMGVLVERYSCGWKTKNSVESIVEKVMMISRADIEIASEGTERGRIELSWERESKTLESIYHSLADKIIEQPF